MKKIILFLLFISAFSNANSQFRYTAKIESAYHIFLSRPVRVDAGLDWRGYELAERPNGFEVGVVNGVSFKGNFRFGLGLSYLNYEGINGNSIYGDVEVATSKARLSPVFNLKIGRSHINNQYEDGSTSSFVDISGGLERKVSEKISLQFKLGFRAVHQSIFFPIRIGARF